MSSPLGAWLPRTFGAFLGRFAAPSPIQRRAIPAIAAGGDVLLCSPTASGKTEAYAAPAAERTLAVGGGGLRVLVVSPTRALANDLERRLAGPLELVGVGHGRYTGEHKQRPMGGLPDFTITTPEALDSLLARRSVLLAGIEILVLDEIHVIDNTARGDQLRCLLERLDGVTAKRAQRVAVSATVDRPEEFAARYLKEPEVIVEPGARGLKVRAFDGIGIDDVARHLDELAGAGFRKVLVFCRGRNQVELYSAKLARRTRFAGQVFAHHGSLAKAQRERTERLFQSAPAAVCFATSTLELGIDIGTVDYVLLIGLPSDVASLLQRIGRGNRRAGASRAGYAAEDAGEAQLFQTLFRLASRGELCAGPYGFRPAVLLQQALSLACAEDWIEAPRLAACMPANVSRELGPGAAGRLLDVLAEAGLLERHPGGRFVASEAVEARYRRGVLHSNLADDSSFQVIDRLTGQAIGRVDQVEVGGLELGGQGRRVVHEQGRRILTDRAGESSPARFVPRGSPWVPLALARAQVEALGVAPGTLLEVPGPKGPLLLHGLGTLGAHLLDFVLSGGGGARIDPFKSPYLRRLVRPLKEVPALDGALFERFLAGYLDGLAQFTAQGPFAAHLPAELARPATRRILGIDLVATYLRGVRLERAGDLDPRFEHALDW